MTLTNSHRDLGDPIDQGYVVDVAASGAAALQALERVTYDMMLLDLKMPGIDGVEVMRRVHAAGLDLPVVIITAHPTVESAIIAVRTGVRDYLPNPFGADELLAVVEKVIAARIKEQRRKLLLNTITETVAQLQNPGIRRRRRLQPHLRPTAGHTARGHPACSEPGSSVSIVKNATSFCATRKIPRGTHGRRSGYPLTVDD